MAPVEKTLQLSCAGAFLPTDALLKRRDWRKWVLRLGPVRLLGLKYSRRPIRAGGMIAFKLPILVAPRTRAVLRVETAGTGGIAEIGAIANGRKPDPAEGRTIVEIAGCPPQPASSRLASGLQDSAHGTGFIIDRPGCVEFRLTAKGREYRGRVPVGVRSCPRRAS